MIDYYDDADSQELFADGFDLWADDDPLAQRLRTMTWTHTPDEVRERCWAQIQQWMQAHQAVEAELIASAEPEVNCDRYLYTRRHLQPRVLASAPRAVAAPVRHFRPRTLAWAFR